MSAVLGGLQPLTRLLTLCRSLCPVQNIAAEVRTYNTIIGACARAGQPDAAASVYDRMLQDHAVPTATTATALVSAFAKVDQASARVGTIKILCKQVEALTFTLIRRFYCFCTAIAQLHCMAGMHGRNDHIHKLDHCL